MLNIDRASLLLHCSQKKVIINLDSCHIYKTMDKTDVFSLCAVILRVLIYASRENRVLAQRCDGYWRGQLNNFSKRELLFKLKFVLSGCSFKTLGKLFESGVIPRTRAYTRLLYGILQRRGGLSISSVQNIIRETKLWNGEFRENLFPIVFAFSDFL